MKMAGRIKNPFLGVFSPNYVPSNLENDEEL